MSEPLRDCFPAALAYAIENPDAILVHAEVAGHGKLEGQTFAHAYCVEGDWVVDQAEGRTGDAARVPRVIYEAVGRVEAIGNRFEYSHREALRLSLLHGHYGPWDLETDQ